MNPTQSRSLQDSRSTLEKIRSALFQNRKVLGQLYREMGDISLYDYIKHQSKSSFISDPSRRKEIIGIISDEVERLLGKERAVSCAEQLERNYFVITADHHGPLCQQNFLTGHLLAATTTLNGENNNQNIIVLSCANISFDNVSFPRGLVYHTVNNGEVILNSFPFFPRKVRPFPVFRFPHYEKEFVDENFQKLKLTEKANLSESQFISLQETIDSIFLKEDQFKLDSFSDQVTVMNAQLWQKYLTSKHEGKINLVTLEQENIVMKALLKYHLSGTTEIDELLFSQKLIPYIEQYFDGISGAFDLKNKKGTYMFWGYPKDAKYRAQLWRRGDFLETEDGSFRVKLDPTGIRQALEEKTIYPSTLLSFILLSFYYGLKLAGGYRQIDYFTSMKHAYDKLQMHIKSAPLNEPSTPETTELDPSRPIIAFLKTPSGDFIPATGLDMILYGQDNMWETFGEMMKTITLGDAINRACPSYYYSDFPEEVEPLAGFGEKEVEVAIGLDKKIIPIGQLSPL
ncbi:MAG: hypothetical protein O3B87_01870 [bacterium]|nr:hypothetical protein [bacterium]